MREGHWEDILERWDGWDPGCWHRVTLSHCDMWSGEGRALTYWAGCRAGCRGQGGGWPAESRA